MKKSFTANINGSIFYIDEDAFNLLNNYLEQLHTAFPGPDGDEIVSDIEARIGEVLNEREGANSNIVTIEDINDVIARVGSPADLNDSAAKTNQDSQASDTTTATPPPYYPSEPQDKRLFRDESNRVLGGVLSGIAKYYGWNTGLLRILVTVLAMTTWFFPCFIAYIVAWCVIPAARTPIQRLEMTGQPINPATLGSQMLSSQPTESASSQIGRIIGVGFLAFIGLICGSLFISALAGLIWSVGSLLGVTLFAIPWDANFYIYQSAPAPLFALLMSLAGLLFFGIILWAIGIVLFKFPKISSTTLIVCAVIEFILLVACVIMGNALASNLALF